MAVPRGRATKPWRGVGDSKANSKVWLSCDSFEPCFSFRDRLVQGLGSVTASFITSSFPVIRTKMTVAQTESILPTLDRVFQPLKALG
jgi:hypothetical protein